MMLQIRIYVALSVKLRHISGMFETIGWRNVPGVEHRETQELDFKSMIQRVLLATHFLPSSLNHSLPFTRRNGLSPFFNPKNVSWGSVLGKAALDEPPSLLLWQSVHLHD